MAHSVSTFEYDIHVFILAGLTGNQDLISYCYSVLEIAGRLLLERFWVQNVRIQWVWSTYHRLSNINYELMYEDYQLS